MAGTGCASAGLARSPGGELVGGRGRCHIVRRCLGQLRGKVSQAALDLLPYPAEGDPEDTLTALEQVDDLVRGSARVDADAIAHQRDSGQVSRPALGEERHRRADLLQRDTRVQQALYDLEDKNVPESVQALGTRAARRADTRLDQPGAGPVVQLAVGDPRGGACHRAAESDVVGHRACTRRSHLAEEQLLPLGLRGLPLTLRAVLITLRAVLITLRALASGHLGLRLSASRHRPSAPRYSHAHLRRQALGAWVYLSHGRPAGRPESTIPSGASRP